jgi:hypothetical protein
VIDLIERLELLVQSERTIIGNPCMPRASEKLVQNG